MPKKQNKHSNKRDNEETKKVNEENKKTNDTEKTAPRIIELNTVTKVEGHAKLLLNIDENNQIKKCELQSVEGSRYFEGMLVERLYYEASEISSRICGICSCAHTAASIKAIENALGLKVTEQTKILRELFTVGERIRSHITHMYFLSLPDYLGVESGMDLAKDHRDEVMRALRLMKLGNDIVSVFAGRDLHPVSATIGGFLHLPKQEEINSILERLKEAMPDAIAAAKLFASLNYRKYEINTEYCTLIDDGKYPIMEGDLYSSNGDRFPEEKFTEFFTEYHEARSTANFVVKDGKSYLVGALARLNNNYQHLMPEAKKILKESMKSNPQLTFPNNNLFIMPYAQAIETVHFIESAINLLTNFTIKDEKPIEPVVKAGKGTGIIEVPRGLLIHQYELDKKGMITHANIVTPTAQNLRFMEDNVRKVLPALLNLDNESIVLEMEKLIRAFDPCFSCSTHFLEVTFEGSREKIKK